VSTLTVTSTVTSIVLFAGFAVAGAADKEPRFAPAPASSYAFRQSNEKVTIAAVPYTTEEQVRSAFGKLDPNKYGILPMLVVIQNDSNQTLRLDNIKIQYISPGGTHIDATPAKDVPYVSGHIKRPTIENTPLPTGSPRVSRKKNPLAGGQLEVREFSARMLPPGQQASGFFYFQTLHRRGSKLYLTGIREAGSERELFYFEIPLSNDGSQ
jgi:hypothetical protein